MKLIRFAAAAFVAALGALSHAARGEESIYGAWAITMQKTGGDMTHMPDKPFILTMSSDEGRCCKIEASYLTKLAFGLGDT
jgi:hypothetical protein